jgi:hypothetical protein
MSKTRLGPDEAYEIKKNEAEISHLLKSIENAKRFNIGDYLIRFQGEDTKAEQNSYHTERRFEVVHVDIHGVCYIKEVTGNKSSGFVMTLASYHDCGEEAYRTINGIKNMEIYRYELDPLYEDHIIMQQDGKYDPSSIQGDKSKLHKEITAYNKSIKIKTNTSADTLKFAKTIKVGDTLWFSNVTSFIVQELKPMPRNNNNHSAQWEPVILGVTNKGKSLKLSISGLFCKAIYTACPRSYKEMKA